MRSVASRASIARRCAEANSRKMPPSVSMASSSSVTLEKRASCRMIVPRMTSATPARRISRVASAMSESKNAAARVPRIAASPTAAIASKTYAAKAAERRVVPKRTSAAPGWSGTVTCVSPSSP